MQRYSPGTIIPGGSGGRYRARAHLNDGRVALSEVHRLGIVPDQPMHRTGNEAGT